MRFFVAIFAICMSMVMVSAQYFRQNYDFGYNAVSGDFGGPSAFGGSGFQTGNVRDARQDRGPVVFPPAPPNQPAESSGVIVGASGYGFVPPQQQSSFYENYRNFRFY